MNKEPTKVIKTRHDADKNAAKAEPTIKVSLSPKQTLDWLKYHMKIPNLAYYKCAVDILEKTKSELKKRGYEV